MMIRSEITFITEILPNHVLRLLGRHTVRCFAQINRSHVYVRCGRVARFRRPYRGMININMDGFGRQDGAAKRIWIFDRRRHRYLDRFGFEYCRFTGSRLDICRFRIFFEFNPFLLRCFVLWGRFIGVLFHDGFTAWWASKCSCELKIPIYRVRLGTAYSPVRIILFNWS